MLNQSSDTPLSNVLLNSVVNANLCYDITALAELLDNSLDEVSLNGNINHSFFLKRILACLFSSMYSFEGYKWSYLCEHRCVRE
jgi:hypothetical protein